MDELRQIWDLICPSVQLPVLPYCHVYLSTVRYRVFSLSPALKPVVSGISVEVMVLALATVCVSNKQDLCWNIVCWVGAKFNTQFVSCTASGLFLFFCLVFNVFSQICKMKFSLQCHWHGLFLYVVLRPLIKSPY